MDDGKYSFWAIPPSSKQTRDIQRGARKIAKLVYNSNN